MKTFINENSIVREIWGNADTVLFVFAGAAAEFSLSKAVDWLYFTGKLPAQPLERLFTTVSYAQKIIYENKEVALAAVSQMTKIHSSVEQKRGQKIPSWAYLDVLFMLIHYSIASYELLHRKLSETEKDEVFTAFHELGLAMELEDLPSDRAAYEIKRASHLTRNYTYCQLTEDLYIQYKKHLGKPRYHLLVEVQKLLVPATIRRQLMLRKGSYLSYFVPLYKVLSGNILFEKIKLLMMPKAFQNQIQNLNKY